MFTYEGRIAGTGVIPAFVEHEETWNDKKVWNVIFPKHQDDYEREVTCGNINDLDEDTRIRLDLV